MHGKPSIDELIAKCPTDLKQLGYAAVNGCSKPPSVGQLQSQGTGNSFHEIHQWNSLNFTSWSSYCFPLVSGVLGLREPWLILSISFTRANGLVMMAMMIIIYYYRVCVLPTIVSFFETYQIGYHKYMNRFSSVFSDWNWAGRSSHIFSWSAAKAPF